MSLNRPLSRISIRLLALCFLPATLLAQQPPSGVTTQHSLWQARGKSNVVYLLGSVHILKAENYPLPAVIDSAFTNSAVVAFETDIDAMEQPELQMKIMAKARLPDGSTLRDQLSPTVYASFTNHVNQIGLPVEMFEPLKPALAAITLAVVDLQKLGFDPDYGLDKHFFALAKKAGKQTAALETVDFQVSLLTDLSKEEGELVMQTTLKDIDRLKTDIADLLKAWQTGDADALEKLLNEASREAPAIYKRLLTDRSANWVPKIQEWLRGDKNVIVIVGAGHLVGKDGVVELLRKSGQKVEQL
jgi:uncharacterized protein YbaP (TraB family)